MVTLIASLQALQQQAPNIVVSLRMTTMQDGEALVLAGACSLAVTVADVPELSVGAIERHWLCDTPMVTVCAPSHPLATAQSPVLLDEFSRHNQLVVTDNQPDAEKTLVSVAGERRWLVNDLSAKHDFLRAGLGWGHMPAELVADDLVTGRLITIERYAWHMRPLTFMVSRRRGRQSSASENRLIELLAGAQRRIVTLNLLIEIMSSRNTDGRSVHDDDQWPFADILVRAAIGGVFATLNSEV